MLLEFEVVLAPDAPLQFQTCGHGFLAKVGHPGEHVDLGWVSPIALGVEIDQADIIDRARRADAVIVQIKVARGETGAVGEAAVGEQMDLGGDALSGDVGARLGGIFIRGPAGRVLGRLMRIGQAVGQAQGFLDARGPLCLLDAAQTLRSRPLSLV